MVAAGSAVFSHDFSAAFDLTLTSRQAEARRPVRHGLPIAVVVIASAVITLIL